MKTYSVLLIAISLIMSLSVEAKKNRRVRRSADKNLNSLGANDAILKRIRAYKSRHKIKVVQKRAVDRNFRFELGPSYNVISGGDPYTDSAAAGAQLEFHINPRWSLGVRYYDYKNTLNAEGKNIFDRASQVNTNSQEGLFGYVPEMDLMKSSTMATVSWYPVYGKLNFFDWKVAQFDLYALLGSGQMQLESGPTSTYMLGAGLGLWYTQHVSSRLEVRYQTYTDKVSYGERDQDLLSVSFMIGIMI